ncbi:MAG: diacylglycerol kinase [Porticoccaceae bacterium]|nr:diacylglycerol kinase [Porticoccaceae bacterium]
MTSLPGLLYRRFVLALRYSCQGLVACFRHEEAFRVEVLLASVLIPAGLLLGDTPIERVLLVSVVVLVMVVELLNSAVEAAIDRISLDPSELSGRAKDLGSAAVFLSMMLVLFVWGAILL